MKPALGYRWIEPVDDWLGFPNGEALKISEQEVIRNRLSLCFGNHLLKLGALAEDISTKESLINHQICLSGQANKATGVVGDTDDLPFLSNSIDAAIMPHVLEFSVDPHQSLREVHRILMPNGNLILTVFNPLSVILLGKLWPLKSYRAFWQGRMFTIARIKDWLNLLGFEVIDESYLSHNIFLPYNADKKSGRLAKFVASFLPKISPVCVITVKKREWPLTPIRPRVRYRTVFQPAVGSATMNRKTTTFCHSQKEQKY